MSNLEPVIKVVRLPDGRWAVENGQGVGDLTREDIPEMWEVLRMWFDIRWRTMKEPR